MSKSLEENLFECQTILNQMFADQIAELKKRVTELEKRTEVKDARSTDHLK